MASVTRSKTDGTYRVMFAGVRGKRQTIYLGKTTARAAETVKAHVEELVNASVSGTTTARETAGWLADLPDALRVKLEKAELVRPRDRKDATPTIAAHIDGYLARRTDIKQTTRSDIANAGKCLVAFAGETKRVDEFTKGDAADWLRWMKQQNYADATASRRMGRGSQLFNDALDHELIAKNPFRGVKVPGMRNKARQYHIDAATIEKLLETAVGVEWRLVIALARWGGLRIPSELLGLQWDDVRWDDGKFLVKSPKTERYEGGESRFVPLFPELLPHLRAAWEAAPDGATMVITGDLTRQTNLRSKLLWTLRRAGLKPWERLFQNLRSSRETELVRSFPIHVVCAWLGNTPGVAMKHYLTVTDDDFRKASGSATANAESDAPPTHNPTQTASDEKRQRTTKKP